MCSSEDASHFDRRVTAALRVACEDADALIASLICFDSVGVAALLDLRKGDSCAIAGRAKLSSWTAGGEEKHGLSVTVDRVMSAYQAGKQRKAARALEESTA